MTDHDDMYQMLADMSGNIGKMVGSLDGVDKRLEGMDNRMNAIGAQKGVCEKRFQTLEKVQNRMIGIAIFSAAVGGMFATLLAAIL